jgi:hypothetical protein
MKQSPSGTVVRKVVLTEETVTTRTIRRIELEDIEVVEETTGTRASLPNSIRRVLAKCGVHQEPARLAIGGRRG